MMFKDRMDAIVIGRVMGPAQVGVYSVGQEMGALASTELLEPIAAALFSGLSVARREGGDISQGYLKGISAALMMALPVGVGISLVASPLVALLFGPKWSAAIPLVQVFALVGVTRAITYFSTVLLMTQGKLNFQVRIVLAGSAVRFILLLALIRPLGLMGALAAMAIGAVVEETLFVATTFRMFELSPRALLKATWRSAVATAVMAGVVFWEGVGWASASGDVSHLVTDLAIASITGAVTYCAALIALWWLCGRPNAAETVFLGIVRDTWRHTAGSLFRRPA
jgi:O-antigen/teichoic acid export membrane protein